MTANLLLFFSGLNFITAFLASIVVFQALRVWFTAPKLSRGKHLQRATLSMNRFSRFFSIVILLDIGLFIFHLLQR